MNSKQAARLLDFREPLWVLIAETGKAVPVQTTTTITTITLRASDLLIKAINGATLCVGNN